MWATNQLGDDIGRKSNWATANWATHFSQLGNDIGRVLQDAYVGRNVHK